MKIHLNDEDAHTVLGLVGGIRVYAREQAGSPLPAVASAGANLTLVVEAIEALLRANEDGLDTDERGRRELRLVALGDQMLAGGL